MRQDLAGEVLLTMLEYQFYEGFIVWFFTVRDLVLDWQGQRHLRKRYALRVPKVRISFGISLAVRADVRGIVAFRERS